MTHEEFDMLGEEDLSVAKQAVRAHMCYRCVKHGHFIVVCPEAMEVKPEHKHRPRTDHKHHSRDDYKGKNKSEWRQRKSGGHKKKERVMVACSRDID
jgi:hypothetical protein